MSLLGSIEQPCVHEILASRVSIEKLLSICHVCQMLVIKPTPNEPTRYDVHVWLLLEILVFSIKKKKEEEKL